MRATAVLALLGLAAYGQTPPEDMPAVPRGRRQGGVWNPIAKRYELHGNTPAMDAHNATLDQCRAVDLATRAQRKAARRAERNRERYGDLGRKPRTMREIVRWSCAITGGVA